MSLLDLNADLNLALDVAAPDRPGRRRQRQRRRADQRSGRRERALGRFRGRGAVAHQGVNIDQGLSGSAVAHAPQHSGIDQATPAAGADRAGDGRHADRPPVPRRPRPRRVSALERQPAQRRRQRSRGRQARRPDRRRGRRERQRRRADRRLGRPPTSAPSTPTRRPSPTRRAVDHPAPGRHRPGRLPTRPPRSSSNGPDESHVSGRQGAGAGHRVRPRRACRPSTQLDGRCPATGADHGVELLGALPGSGYRNAAVARPPPRRTDDAAHAPALPRPRGDRRRAHARRGRRGGSAAYGRRVAAEDVRQADRDASCARSVSSAGPTGRSPSSEGQSAARAAVPLGRLGPGGDPADHGARSRSVRPRGRGRGPRASSPSAAGCSSRRDWARPRTRPSTSRCCCWSSSP